ncbi:MAG: hypothetical protein AAF702_01810 [Chloroflexota bacterium]
METISVSNLNVFDNTFDLRRDLHLFMDYVSSREIKRTHRSNQLPKADTKRLAKLMDVESVALEEIAEHGSSGWVDTVDELALSLGFIDYDVKGVYAGYSSQSPSFPDNYIEFNQDKYEEFLQKRLGQQERTLFNCVMDLAHNEFFTYSVLGTLRPFTSRGSATGVMPTLDFTKIRAFLLDELDELEGGVWYSTANWIAHIKRTNPYFLIPKKPKYKAYRGKSPVRYGNFYESEKEWGYDYGRDAIPDNAPNGFERVEGRYIERFLEGIPLLLRYIDVAYRRESYKGLYPTMGQLAAFRVNKHFLQFMRGELGKPRVTVQPNYEVHIESAIFPGYTLSKLKPLGDIVADDTVIVLKLDKRKVAAEAAADENLDVVKLLTDMSDRELPQNIQVELRDWVSQSEKFVLYSGFGLLESSRKRVKAADPFSAEPINENVRLVRNPHKLYLALEEAEYFPLLIRHTDEKLRVLPKQARTVFRTERGSKSGRQGGGKTRGKGKPKSKPELKIKQHTLITLHLPDKETLAVVRHALTAARCPIEGDSNALTLTYGLNNEKAVKDVFKQLEKEYKIVIEELPHV